MVDARRCPTCGTELSADAPAGLCPKCLLQGGFASDAANSAERLAATESHQGTPALSFTPPTPADLASRFPQLEILELLGQGGMGAVYKARQPGLDRLVAVKILPPEAGRDPAFAERFTREGRAMARLSHPHITNVYDFGQADGQFYLVMEYVEGVNLRQAIRSQSVSPPAALTIVTQVCDALQYAHDEGVVHRDIKPENILLDKRGRVKIADFGLAKLLGVGDAATELTGAQQVMGTLRYMAPEQMEGSRNVDHRADIYSLGVVFYELLTGEVPMGRFQPPSAKVQVDVRIDDVVLKSLEREPERRYQHASEVKSEVEAISAPSSVAQPGSAKTSAAALAIGLFLLSAIFAMVNGALVPAERGGVSAWAWWAGAIVCCVGGVAALVWAWRTYHQDSRANWLTTIGWTLWDGTLVACGGLGLAMFASAVVLMRAANLGRVGVGGGIPPAEEALGQTGLLMGAAALVALLVRATWLLFSRLRQVGNQSVRDMDEHAPGAGYENGHAERTPNSLPPPLGFGFAVAGVFVLAWVVAGALRYFGAFGLAAAIAVMAIVTYAVLQWKLAYLPKLNAELTQQSRGSRRAALTVSLILFALGMLAINGFLTDGYSWYCFGRMGPSDLRSGALDQLHGSGKLQDHLRLFEEFALDLPEHTAPRFSKEERLGVMAYGVGAAILLFGAVATALATRRFQYSWSLHLRPALHVVLLLLLMLPLPVLADYSAGGLLGWSNGFIFEPARLTRAAVTVDAFKETVLKWASEHDYDVYLMSRGGGGSSDLGSLSHESWELIPQSSFDRCRFAWGFIVRPKPRFTVTCWEPDDGSQSYIVVELPFSGMDTSEEVLWPKMVASLETAISADATADR